MFFSWRIGCPAAIVSVLALSFSGCGGSSSPKTTVTTLPGTVAAHYTVTPLGGLPGFDYSSGVAINSQGQVTGLSTQDGYNSDGTVSHQAHAVLYTAGVLHDLGVPPGYATSTSGGVDDGGEVIVNASRPDATSYIPFNHSFLASNGTFSDPILPETLDTVSVISSNGKIGGLLQTGVGQYHPFLEVNGSVQDLGVPAGYTDCDAVSINSSGDVLGSAVANGNLSAEHAFLYHTGSWIDLGTLGTGYSQAEGLNDLDQATGYSGTNTGGHAFLYSQGKMQDLGTLSGFVSSQGNAVSNQGIVVGKAFIVTSNVSAPAHAFIYAHAQMQDLNALLPAGSGWVLQSANAINSAGQIVGDGLYQGQDQGFLLTPAS